MPQVDPNDPRAPYQQIADDLRGRIRSGEPGAGQKLASSRDLAVQYGVSPMTVHQAVRLLREEGLVESWQGRGVFVRDPAASPTRIHSPATAGLAADLESLQEAVEAATDRHDADITELKRQLADVQARLIELYARTGHAYPQETRPAPRKKASGA